MHLQWKIKLAVGTDFVMMFEFLFCRKTSLEEVKKYEMLPPHENLVKFYRAWEENQILYMQLELCGERSVKGLCCCCLSSNTGWPVHCMHTQSSNFVCETVSLLVISVQCPANWYGYFKASACTYTCEERAADQIWIILTNLSMITGGCLYCSQEDKIDIEVIGFWCFMAQFLHAVISDDKVIRIE